MKINIMRQFIIYPIILFLFMMVCCHANAQDAAPTVRFFSIDDNEEVEVNPGESKTGQAPLELSLTANISNPNSYNYSCEWKVYKVANSINSSNENKEELIIDRFEEDTQFTIKDFANYKIQLSVVFTLDNDTVNYESDVISISISESQLTTPDGFSPNGDNINDTFRATIKSIVKLNASFFNRWGQKLHSVSLENAERADDDSSKLILWDGKINGNVVADGVYMMNIQAVGSDGRKYNIKKAINVLKGFKETGETSN